MSTWRERVNGVCIAIEVILKAHGCRYFEVAPEETMVRKIGIETNSAPQARRCANALVSSGFDLDHIRVSGGSTGRWVWITLPENDWGRAGPVDNSE